MTDENGFPWDGHVLPWSEGVRLIETERLRQQVVEGYHQDFDRVHTAGQLIGAAICYALHAANQPIPPGLWPWDDKPFRPFKPANPLDNGWRISDLRRGGALIAAEIDRLLALQQKPSDETINQKRAEMGLPPIELKDES